MLAHPPLRDRMLYGLKKISSNVVTGVSNKPEYPLTCGNFEDSLKLLYNLTTEEVVDMNKLNYQWLLKDAKEDLLHYVYAFNLTEIGLTDSNLAYICTEV